MLMGCQGNGSLPITIPDASKQQSEVTSIDSTVAQATAQPNFATYESVEASNFGMIGDGQTDDTAAFQNALGQGNRTVHVTAGDYIIGKTVIPANTALLLDPGVTLRDSGKLGPQDRLLNILDKNVYIQGTGARVIANRSDYTTGEWRHGVNIDGASNVVIVGLESSDQGGDGFYIGGDDPARPAQDVILKNCLASDNRRQGLSIVNARRVYVVDCEFDHTNGTAPQFGIDIEPDVASQYLDQIHILAPYTMANAGGGIQVAVQNLDASSAPVTIDILNHDSQQESPTLYTYGPSGLPVTIQYTATQQSSDQ